MDDQFDNELKNQISEMFENFEHQSVDKGWLLFQDKLPEIERKGRINWVWIVSIAAFALLAFFGIAIVVKHSDDNAKRLSNKTINHNNYQNQISAQNKQDATTANSSNHAITDQNLIAAKVKPDTEKQLLATNYSPKNQTSLSKGSNTLVIKQQSIKNGAAKTQTIKSDNKAFSETTNKNQAIAIVQTTGSVENSTAVSNTDTSQSSRKEEIAASSSVNDTIIAKNHSVAASKKMASKQKLTTVKDKKRFEFGAYVSTYFSHAQGTSFKLNAGAGVTADIRLFKNLKLSTGLAVEQNTLDYGNQLPNLIGVINTGSALAFQLVQQTSAITANTNYSLVLTNYTIQMLALDVPLNLKYDFSSQKNDRYFSIGLSSGVFIHQSYTYRYNYSLMPVQTSAINNGLSGLYLAKTLNVALGLGYPVGKSNSLTIEPFLKYPLSGLGDQGIRYGSGGINLKLGFRSSR